MANLFGLGCGFYLTGGDCLVDYVGWNHPFFVVFRVCLDTFGAVSGFVLSWLSCCLRV